jgi:voltage-gated potassium channel
MRKLNILWKIIKMAALDKIIYGFIIFVLVISFIITLVEPSIYTYGDGLWYSFISFTTIGFGDIVAITFIGRICTVILVIYGMLIIALIPGVIVSYYQEIIKIKSDNNISEFLLDLERLPNLPKERLEEISNNIKKRRYKI